MRIIIPVISAALLLSAWSVVTEVSQTNPSALPADAATVRHEIEQVKSIIRKLRDRGPALFLLAHDYAHLGAMDEALDYLQQCISLDQGFDPQGDEEFARLKGNPQFEKLLERVHSRYRPVHRAHLAFAVEQKELIPEGLAVDPKTAVLYMSSLNLRKIVKITHDGDVSDFIRTGQYSIGPICGLKVEAEDASLWANVCPDSGSGAELLHFDKAGRLVDRFSPPSSGPHSFNDLVIRSKDEIYLTDSLANRVYRFDRRLHRFAEVRLSRDIFYPNGIALSSDGNLLYVADAFGLLLLDLRNGKSEEVEPAPSTTLSGADGLYWYKNTLIAVQNSLGLPRIAVFQLSSDERRVTGVTPLEYKSPLVQLPTTGAIAASQFYFISNTGVDNFKDGKIVDPAKLVPIQISVVDLEPLKK